MPDALTDYCRTGGVSLSDRLTPEQVAELLEEEGGGMHAKKRKAAMRALEPSQRMQMSGLALLHAHAATHGQGCALSHVKKGAHPNIVRDRLMVTIYRQLTGDDTSADARIVSKSQELLRRRMSGGDKPSPAMRRSFGALQLVERASIGVISGSERLGLEITSGKGSTVMALKKDQTWRDMDVKGLKIGGMLLVKAPAPPDGKPSWFQGRIRGFFFRCGLPPVLVTFIATEAGERDPSLLPTPTDSACFKHATRECPPLQIL